MFARPQYKSDGGSGFTLCEPNNSLLATAWPALETEVRERFEGWSRAAREADITAIAAQVQGALLEMPAPIKPTLLRRLPQDFELPARVRFSDPSPAIVGGEADALYRRHEGGAAARALGLAMHALFERFARLAEGMSMEAAQAALRDLELPLVAQSRAAGIAPAAAAEIARQAINSTLEALQDPIAAWILTPHPHAGSEMGWTGVIDGAMRNVRADRVFRAGDAPGENGDAIWWIIDYKTAHPEGDAENVVAQLRPLFAPQLEMYGRFLRKLHGDAIEVRAGLYYPRLRQFDWWKL